MKTPLVLVLFNNIFIGSCSGIAEVQVVRDIKIIEGKTLGNN